MFGLRGIEVLIIYVLVKGTFYYTWAIFINLNFNVVMIDSLLSKMILLHCEKKILLKVYLHNDLTKISFSIKKKIYISIQCCMLLYSCQIILFLNRLFALYMFSDALSF